MTTVLHYLCLCISLTADFGIRTRFKIDRSKGLNVVSVDISKVKRIELDTDYFNKISKLLSTQEAELINKSDVYPTSIGRIDYYHLVELEDGDFVESLSMDYYLKYPMTERWKN